MLVDHSALGGEMRLTDPLKVLESGKTSEGYVVPRKALDDLRAGVEAFCK